MKNLNTADSQLQLSHLNVNMWISWVRDSVKNSVYGTLAFFSENNPENIYNNWNLKAIVSPILERWWDILWFSEVYGKQNLDILVELLESKWYNVYFVDAFEMWSQNIPWEHLYNVVWIKNEIDPKKWPFIKTKLLNQRKQAGILISLKNLLNSHNHIEKNRFSQSIDLYKRLANWILDGAITSFEISDDLVLSHLHIHSDNINIQNNFSSHLQSDKAHVMFWDFNIWDLGSFILEPPFAWIWYKKFLSEEDRTYSFAKWFWSLPVIKRPDDVIWNSKIQNISTISIPSLSDHNAIISRIKVK